jgi:hypothetical protein
MTTPRLTTVPTTDVIFRSRQPEERSPTQWMMGKHVFTAPIGIELDLNWFLSVSQTYVQLINQIMMCKVHICEIKRGCGFAGLERSTKTSVTDDSRDNREGIGVS